MYHQAQDLYATVLSGAMNTYGEQDDLSGVAEGIITYSDIEDSIGETFNNMSVDPDFADPDTYNFPFTAFISGYK